MLDTNHFVIIFDGGMLETIREEYEDARQSGQDLVATQEAQAKKGDLLAEVLPTSDGQWSLRYGSNLQNFDLVAPYRTDFNSIVQLAGTWVNEAPKPNRRVVYIRKRDIQNLEFQDCINILEGGIGYR